MNRLPVVALILVIVAAIAAAEVNGPVIADFDDLLSFFGVARSELSVQVPKSWSRGIPSSSVDHALPHLLPTLRDPPRLMSLGRELAAAASSPRTNATGSHPLSRLFDAVALIPRGLDSNELSARFASARAPAPLPPLQDLPPGLRPVVEEVLGACVLAAQEVHSSWAGLTPEEVAAAVDLQDVARGLGGGEAWWPAIDRAAGLGDDGRRAGAASRLVRAAETAVQDLEAACAGDLCDDLHWQVTTSLGRVTVSGTENHEHRCRDDCLLIIDLGGNDTYLGSVGAARYPDQSVSVVIDLAGDDSYDQVDARCAQGAGLGGIGALVDVSGNDTYRGRNRAQGFAILGYAVLWDLGGNDRYSAAGSCQGSALFGAGMLVDSSGSDTYSAHGEGQGFAGPGAAGALVDLDGDDVYLAEPDPAYAGRADYHSGGRVAANNSQGAGVGRRGDLGTGKSWAGGLGVLADVAGDDVYRAGNFAQGMGYWLGTGMLLDGDGDDEYHSVYFTQGAALHFGLGLLLDEAGSDLHWLTGEAGASLGYGWDRAVGLCVDGGGDDLYRLGGTGLGCAERRSVGIFVDSHGCDTYSLSQTARGLGAVDGGPASERTGARMVQMALFADLEGVDLYELSHTDADYRAGNDRLWTWVNGQTGRSTGNLGAGADLAGPGPGSAGQFFDSEN